MKNKNGWHEGMTEEEEDNWFNNLGATDEEIEAETKSRENQEFWGTMLMFMIVGFAALAFYTI